MELLLLPSRAAAARPLLLPTSPRHLHRSGTVRPAAASSSNAEAVDTGAASTSGAASKQAGRQGWRAGGLDHGLGLDLSEDMRRGMMWRMVAPPAAAVAAEVAFRGLLDRAAPGDAPAWAASTGSAVLFAVGLLGVHYGFLSSRWDAAETGSVVGWDLAVRHWNALATARESSSSSAEEEEEYDGDDEEYEDEDDYEEEDEEDSD